MLLAKGRYFCKLMKKNIILSLSIFVLCTNSTFAQATNEATFAHQKDFEKAEATYLEVLDLCKENNEKSHQAAQVLLELVSLYLDEKQYQQAATYNQQALQLVEELNILDLKVDFLHFKGLLALEQQDFKIAWAAYLEAREIAKNLQNPALEKRGELLKAKIYHTEGLPDRALVIYQFYLAKDTQEDLLYTQDLLTELHEICSEVGDYPQAYQYLGELTTLKDEIAREKKMQQRAYLQAKFSVEEKDKENVLLATEVKQKQHQEQYLFAVIGLSVLGICFLIGAFIQKKKYNRRLQAEVVSRTQELEQSNRELDEFNRILSHDLKEPLRSIVGFSTLASKEVFGNSRAMEYLGYIEKSGRQLHQIIEDVSTYQSIESYAESPAEWVNTNELLDFICEAEEFQLLGKSLHLEKIDVRPIYAKRSFVYLIFKNLLENGMKYNRHAEVRIRVAYEKKQGQHVFTFTDNGIGIAPEYHQQIFQMFKRLNDRKSYDGSGLGLSIVAKMVEKVEGSICLLESQEGRGTTFELCLPIAAVEETWTKKRQRTKITA